MSTIQCIRSREIIDSRAQPTLEVDVVLKSGTWGRAAVPSGASTGAHEACELRDADPQRFHGRGVLKAAHNVEKIIAPRLVGHEVFDWQETDRILNALDTSGNKSQLGANAILGVSLAAARAAANEKKQDLFQFLKQHDKISLPVPMFNVLNGGRHANNNLDVQEFMIVPKGVSQFRQALRMGCEVFGELKKLLHARGLSTAVGDEGGFAPALKSNREALDLLVQAIENSNYQLGTQVALALDVAATELSEQQDGKYVYHWEGQKKTAPQLEQIYAQWAQEYPLYSIEDAFAEDDWTAWKEFSTQHKSHLQLVGDDIFVTQAGRLKKGIEQGIANALLVKINQAGTLSETWEAVQLAQACNYECVMSHRSGETEDTSIADLAVAFGCRQIKMGSPCRSERVAKYNRLLRIEEALGQNCF